MRQTKTDGYAVGFLLFNLIVPTRERGNDQSINAHAFPKRITPPTQVT